MNHDAEEFTDGYYSDFCYACSAAVDGLKELGDYETSGADSIRNLFISISVALLNECSLHMSDQFVSFVADVVYYLDDELSYLIEESALSEKRRYLEDVRKSFNTTTPIGIFSFDILKGMLLVCLRFCAISDQSAMQSLVGALTRYTFLLINIDGSPSPKCENFYRNLKVLLALDINSKEVDHHLPALVEGNIDSDSDSSSCRVQSNINKENSSSPMELQTLIDEINCLIGLDSIKAEVSELVNMLRVQQMRIQAGFPRPDTTKHMVFFGNPGTGKTTIARKLGEIYKNLNLLSKGHFVETDRAGLVAGYLGQTALKTKDVLDSAKGGILFIDEAYTLSPPNDQDLFGQEAIDTILKYMEDNRDDIVVIVAGYQNRMERFISSNPGLKSRFGKYFYFPDYSSDELASIFLDIVTKSSYSFAAGFKERLDPVCSVISSKKDDNFGNGRVMRNLFDKCIANHANRVIQIPNATSDQLMELRPEDLDDEDIDAVTR